MAAIANDIDRILDAYVPPAEPEPERLLLLGCSSPGGFKVAADGTASPTSITFNAVRFNLEGAATFSASNGAVLTVNGDQAALDYANMPANSTTVTVTVGSESREITISKVFDASSRFTWIKYADSAAGAGISDDPTDKEYIGFAYNKTAQAESNNPADYAWSLIKGGDGVQGPKGADGTTYYTWIKYADQPDGTGLYDVPTANTLYIGIAVNRLTATESTNKADYVWSRFKGEKGDQGVPGTGQRGPGWFYATGSAWDDNAAHAATPGETQVDDTVTISNGTVTYTKRWNGSAWYVPGAYMDGSLFVEKSITAAKINTNGLEVRDPSGNLILSVGGLRPGFEAPDTKNSEIAVGGNLCYNADFSNGVAGWTVSTNNNGVYDDYSNAEHPRIAGPDWTVNAGHGQGSTTLHVHQPNGATSAPDGYPVNFERYSDPIPVEGGKRYCVSAYTGAHRCRVDVFAYYYDAAGGYLGAWGADEDYNDNVYSGGRALADYKRHQRVTTLPANAAAVRIALRKFCTTSGFADSYAFFARVQLEQVAANATAAGPWSPPSPSAKVYNTLEAVVSDGVLDRAEKAALITEWQTEDLVHAQLVAQANALGVSAQQYIDNHNATSGYLLSLSPAWDDVTQDTPIDRTLHRNRFKWLYEARAILQNALNTKVKQLADAAQSSANTANNGLADKLSKSAASALAATITLQTGGVLLAGDGTNGVYMHSSGLVGVQGGVVKFSIPISGNPLFAGMLQAAFGTFGAVTLDAATGSFSSGQTAYDTGTGWWMGYVGGVVKFSIGTAGGGALLWDGTTLKIRQAVLEGTGLGGPTLTLSSSPSTMYFTYTRTISGGNAGAITANASGTGLTYEWKIEGNVGNRVLYSVNGYSSGTIQLSVNGGGAIGTFDWTVTCTVTDSKGLSVTKNMIVTVELT